jgi:hypothetical protein
MLKKMMKAVLTVALVAGLAGPAMAETKIGGKVAAYFGQYNSGVDGTAAYFDEADEVNLDVVSQRGPVKAYFQIESDRAGGTDYFHNTRRSVAYQMNESIGFNIGTNVTGVPFSILSGMKAHTVPGEFIGVYWAFAEGDGLGVNIGLGEGMKAQVTLYDGDVLSNPFTGNAGVSGSATQLGFDGKFGAIAAKLSYVMSNTDNHMDATPDATSNSAYNAGVKYAMEGLSFSLDLFSKTMDQADPDTGNALQVRADAGPGNVIFTYASRAKANKDALGWINLAYDINLSEGAGMQVVYTSNTTTPDGGSATTASYIGAGFYAGF